MNPEANLKIVAEQEIKISLSHSFVGKQPFECNPLTLRHRPTVNSPGMKQIRRFALLSFWWLAAHSLYGQVKIEGEMSLGDTTQVHFLSTTSGNILEGRVISFTQEEVVFKWEQTTLHFPIAQIQSIRVKPREKPPETNWAWEEKGDTGRQEKPRPPDETDFQYEVEVKAGAEAVSGRLVNYSSGVFKFQKKNASPRFIHRKDLLNLKLRSPNFRETGEKLEKLHILHTHERDDRFVGQVLSCNGVEVEFLTISGARLTFLLVKVRSITFDSYEKSISSTYVRGASVLSGYDRLVLTSSAFSYPTGAHEWRNVMLFYNSFKYGITDHASMDVGLLPLILLNVASVNLKITGDLSEHLHVGIGGQLWGYATVFDEKGHFVNVYGMASMGVKERFINLGAGRGNATDSGSFNFYSLGGATMLGKKVRLTGEYIRGKSSDSNDDFVLFNSLLQFMGRKSRFDLGFVVVPDSSGGSGGGAPFIGFGRLF